jgi:predicted transcriptional regulator
LNGRKARAGAADAEVYNAILDAVQGEDASRLNEARAATKARIARAVNEALNFSVAVKMVWVYSRHVRFLSKSSC